MKLGEAFQIAYESAEDHRLVIHPKKMPPPINHIRRNLICILPSGIPHKHARIETLLRNLNLNPHSFRHTHATKLIEAGAKPVDVAARLGHADVTITQNLYTHDTDEMKKETARIFGEVVGK